jgi:5-methylcytosine-specific restriction endonuclease McrA
MRVSEFNSDQYAPEKLAVFAFRHGGLKVSYNCEQILFSGARIRQARALRIRGKVIPGPWQLNRSGTRWTFYHRTIPFTAIGVIPSYEVYWALGCSFRCANFESYGAGITHWRILKKEQECASSAETFETKPHDQTRHCPDCFGRLKLLEKTSPLKRSEIWLTPDVVMDRDQRDTDSNLGCVRKFVAKGRFTPTEFRRLSALYGNVCLCCGKNGHLVPDHVIPLESGGDDNISNIQPLCQTCNARKGTKCTDYRPERMVGNSVKKMLPIGKAPLKKVGT